MMNNQMSIRASICIGSANGEEDLEIFEYCFIDLPKVGETLTIRYANKPKEKFMIKEIAHTISEVDGLFHRNMPHDVTIYVEKVELKVSE